MKDGEGQKRVLKTPN